MAALAPSSRVLDEDARHPLHLAAKRAAQERAERAFWLAHLRGEHLEEGLGLAVGALRVLKAPDPRHRWGRPSLRLVFVEVEPVIDDLAELGDAIEEVALDVAGVGAHGPQEHVHAAGDAGHAKR